jgi:hypothetical protein
MDQTFTQIALVTLVLGMWVVTIILRRKGIL